MAGYTKEQLIEFIGRQAEKTGEPLTEAEQGVVGRMSYSELCSTLRKLQARNIRLRGGVLGIRG